MSVHEIQTSESDAKQVMELVLKEAPKLKALVVLAVGKDNSRLVWTNRSTLQERSFLLQYFQALVNKWLME